MKEGIYDRKSKKQVCELLDKDNSGHGMDHINRVLNLSLKFAEKENANKDIVSLLHDVDDYKLFGTENAKRILIPCFFPDREGCNITRVRTKMYRHILIKNI